MKGECQSHDKQHNCNWKVTWLDTYGIFELMNFFYPQKLFYTCDEESYAVAAKIPLLPLQFQRDQPPWEQIEWKKVTSLNKDFKERFMIQSVWLSTGCKQRGNQNAGTLPGFPSHRKTEHCYDFNFTVIIIHFTPTPQKMESCHTLAHSILVLGLLTFHCKLLSLICHSPNKTELFHTTYSKSFMTALCLNIQTAIPRFHYNFTTL